MEEQALLEEYDFMLQFVSVCLVMHQIVKIETCGDFFLLFYYANYLVPHTSLTCWDLSLGILLIGTLVTTRLIAINKQTELSET